MRDGGMDGPKGAVRILASQFILMTTSSVKKLLRKKGFKSRRKVRTNMVSRDNKKVCLAWAKAHRHYTVTGWPKWVFSDETRVNM